MSTRPFRFIHASDFHLEQPLMGVAEVPDHLRDLFLDAPYTAAQRVFDAALAEDVDFVVLSGDILHPPGCGPRGPLFLVRQFARLAERGIGVYWAGGTIDPFDAWPTAFSLPQNVHIFPHGRAEQVTIQRDGATLARLVGVGRDRNRAIRPSDFSPDPTGLHTIAVAHGDIDPAALQGRGVHYWALGGRHDRCTPQGGSHAVLHYCGSPQGRWPRETGVHGCTLVQVEPQSPARTCFVPTDVVQWLDERIAIAETTTRESLESQLRDRMNALQGTGISREGRGERVEGREICESKIPNQQISSLQSLSLRPSSNPESPVPNSSAGTGLLISWTIIGSGPLAAQLRRTRLAAELLEWLRDNYGRRSPEAWSVSLDVEVSEMLPPDWYEQETIRGDFLRAVRQLQMNPEEPLTLDSYMSESHRAGLLAPAAVLDSKAVRDSVLREVAALGVDLLSGEEAHR